MADKHRDISAAGMQFTSEMTTSATHELKNKLGIMNENAGLIQDLFYMEKQGRPLDTARIEAISHKIQDQIRVADGIIKKLNGFAGTMVMSENETDLGQALTNVLEIADRLIAKHRCTVQVTPPDAPLVVAAVPFQVQNLLWVCVRTACQMAEDAGNIRVTLTVAEGKPIVSFAIEGTDNHAVSDTDYAEMNMLVDALGAKVSLTDEGKGFSLFWGATPRGGM
ncbi:MAG: hypothetical protein MI802_01810 [Desulfobacterales bacterium]|nr:hypothetical protein [Desulfobacterales bacterium]